MLFKFQMRIVFNRDVENLCLVLFDELLKIPIACMLLVAWERAKKDALQIFLKETSKCAHYIFIYIYLFDLNSKNCRQKKEKAYCIQYGGNRLGFVRPSYTKQIRIIKMPRFRFRSRFWLGPSRISFSWRIPRSNKIIWFGLRYEWNLG